MKSVSPFPDANLQGLVLDNVSDLVVVTDLQFNIVYWNTAAARFYGRSAADVTGLPLHAAMGFAYRHTTAEQAGIDLLTRREWQGEVSVITDGGNTVYFDTTVRFAANEAGEEAGAVLVARDVTQRVKEEMRLRESEKFYRALIADSLDMILLMNSEGLITFSSPAVQRLLGYTPAEVLHTNGFSYIHPDDLGWSRQSFEREVQENPEIKFILIRLRKKSGDWLWCMARGHSLLHVPYVQSVVVYVHDDTPRKQATDALRESEKRFRTLIGDLRIGVLLQDAEGRAVMTNEAFTQIMDLREDELLGRKIWELRNDVIHEDGRPFLRNERPAYKAVATLEVVKDVVMGLRTESRPKRMWLLVNAEPILDGEGNLLNVVCSFTDITERKKREKKSFAEKLAHQRQLAQATIDGQEAERLQIGRELHDSIGQQLTGIKLFLDLAKNSTDPKTAGLVEKALTNVSNVINEVRSMSRSLVPPTLKDLGLVDSVNDLVNSLRTAQPLRFDLNDFSIDEQLLPHNQKLALFRIVQEQLNNVLKHAAATTVQLRLGNANGLVVLEIKDDGVGFDPAGVRRGMGLSNIVNRAELFGGRAVIVSAPGAGCTVKVWLPHPSANGAEE